MKKLFVIGAALLLGSAAHAAEVSPLPKELQGKWCATDTATGGGGPRFWEFQRSTGSCPQQRDDPRLADEDMVLGARSLNNCRAIAGFQWKENNRPVYFRTYRCKDGGGYTAKFELDRDDSNHLTVQYFLSGKGSKP